MDKYTIVGDLKSCDSKSLNENFKRTIITKKGLPNLGTHASVTMPMPLLAPMPKTTPSNTIESLIHSIDDMNDKFETMSQADDDINEDEYNEFCECVKLWIESDNKLLEYEKKRKELMKERNQYNERIMGFMRRHKVDDININENGEKLKFKVSITKGTFTKKILQDSIHNYYIQSTEDAHKLLEYLETQRSAKAKERESLRRMINKKHTLFT
jgi:hypothetical protein